MIKRFYLLFFTGLLFSRISVAQSSANTLDIVSWNMEWFGSASNGPADKNLQETNASKIIQWLNADLYGLVEIVDSMRLRKVVDFIGANEYGFVVSPFCSLATSPTGGNWLNGQKLAFIYRKSVFSNVTTRGLLRSSSNAYTNWASGRFPFMLSATVTINGISRDMNFIVIHGKAGATQSDYLRRLGGAQELKDSLDANFSTATSFIIGDYNDALNTSIYTSASVSSFNPIIMDSTDADHYTSITLPLGAAGQASMINFPNVVDNHVISNEVEAMYVPGSAQIRTDITTVVPDYVTAHTVSDHYPVFSKYNLSVLTSVQETNRDLFSIHVYPNPFAESVNIQSFKTTNNVSVRLMNVYGQVLYQQFIGVMQAGSSVRLHTPSLPKGIYLLQVDSKQTHTTIKLSHQ